MATKLDPPLDRRRDHVLGPDAVPVLLEYGDYECPYCGRAFPAIEQVLSELGDRVAFAYRHLPVAEKHPHAVHAAQAAEAAGAQGRFWDMHRLLFSHQKELDDPGLLRHARELGLDVARFAADLRSGVHARRVREDAESAAAMGLSGTPAFFIDGERYDGFYDAESLGWALQDALTARG